MSKNRARRRSPRVPSAIGMGLIALDLVIAADEDTPPCTYAGGTCANVLIALSYLGWRAFPISRLAQDEAAERLIADLRQWKVSTEFVTKEPDGSTPVIVERIRRLATGVPHHSFSWRCPACGAYLPGYKPVRVSTVHQIALRLKPSQVFFFDRVSRSTLLMAHLSRKRGAVVMFEPPGVGDQALFREAWAVAHVVKYAHERLAHLGEIDLPDAIRNSALLEIETSGIDGLRFRSRLTHAKSDGWVAMPALNAPHLRDTAGAGDWCTAGLLHILAQRGLAGLRRASPAKVREAMEYGQALAAWNCEFEGARGGMYQQNRTQFSAAVRAILGRSHRQVEKNLRQKNRTQHVLPELCRACSEVAGNGEVGTELPKRERPRFAP